MQGLTDIIKGERGLFGLALVIAASIFVGLDRITFEQWQDYTLWIFGVFVGGKTVTTVAGLVAAPKADKPDAPTPPTV